MKNICIKQFFSIIFGIVMLCSFVPMLAMQQEEPMVKQQEVASQSYWIRFKNFLHRTPLFPGWRSTEEQKAAAERTLAHLLVEREKLEDERKSEQVSDERLQEISKELKRINDEINEQKVILGKRWSSGRRLAAGSMALVAGLGAAKYAMSVPSLPGSFNKLVEGKEFRWKVTDNKNGKTSFLEGYKARYIKVYLTDVSKEYGLYVKDKNNQWQDAKYGIFYSLINSKWRCVQKKSGEWPKYFDIY